MTVTYQKDVFNVQYNGWTNYETWNVALWLENDEGLYNLIQDSSVSSYDDLVDILWDCGSKETRDGVKWSDSKINKFEINQNVFGI